MLEVKGNPKKADFWRMNVVCDDNQESVFKNMNEEYDSKRKALS